MHWFEVAVVAAVATTVVQPEPHHYHHHHRPGIGALAFVGGYLAGRRSHHHHHGGCVGCGCGGCGGSCGWCGGGYYGRRRRRSLEDFLGDESIMEAYEKISSEDKDQCGLRLVCELAQSDPRDLAKDEVQILLPYRGAGESDGSVYGQYDEAAWHGQKGHACLEHYPLCAFTAQQIMDEYRKYSQERDDDGDTEESRV